MDGQRDREKGNDKEDRFLCGLGAGTAENKDAIQKMKSTFR